ncbi:MAG TPA: hypothetical protein VM029_21320 [Opitutaceae bacterium]|nr:hypothetical protein [Opitutaceae bacterium]
MAPPDETLQLPAGQIRPGVARGAERFFRAAPDAAGRWWLHAPDGAPFYCRAVHGVRVADAEGDAAPGRDSAVRLRTWGFNAVGVGGDATGREDGFPFLAAVGFCDAGPQVIAPGVRLPDVFDPEWTRIAADHAARVCTALSETRELLGWVMDDGLAWGQSASSGGRPRLLQLCLSLEPSCPAYHAAWEFALALHGGRMEALARAWGVPLANKEVVREMSRAEKAIATRGYSRDEARWTREFARRYFTTTAAAVRAVDPNHLLFGCRFRDPVGAAVLAECVYPAVDVAMPYWMELPGPTGNVSHPMLAGDVRWADDAFFGAATVREHRFTAVERMLRRGRIALTRLATHPAVVGYAWGQWQDEPGEQPPFAGGLIHLNGVEAREHSELLADFNPRAEALRRAAGETIIP